VLEASTSREVGLDFFGFGEHHAGSMSLSSSTALVNASRRHGVTVDGVSTSEIFVAHPRKEFQCGQKRTPASSRLHMRLSVGATWRRLAS
jgi:hypothetical protein